MNINDSYQMKGEKYVVTLAVGVYPTLVPDTGLLFQHQSTLIWTEWSAFSFPRFHSILPVAYSMSDINKEKINFSFHCNQKRN